jgi:hypothetical protein
MARRRLSCATMMTMVPLLVKHRLTSPMVTRVASTVALVCRRYLSRRRLPWSGALSLKPVNYVGQLPIGEI